MFVITVPDPRFGIQYAGLIGTWVVLNCIVLRNVQSQSLRRMGTLVQLPAWS